MGTPNRRAIVANLGLAHAALAAGDALGVDRHWLIELLQGSSGRSFALEARGRMESPAGFRHGGALLRKDLRLLKELLGPDHPAAEALSNAAGGFLAAAATTID